MAHENLEFKSWYIFIFSSNYLLQGIVQSIFAVVIPIYLLSIIGTVAASFIAILASIIMLPWAIKIVFGIISDKFGSKKHGRRRPWILSMITLAGIMWIILGIPGLLTQDNVIIIFLIAGVIINIGVAFADTVLDGLILDICPKEKLGSTQGTCWGFRSIGQIAGGPALAMLIVFVDINVGTIFTLFGILSIIASLLMILIKEPTTYPEVNLKLHLKEMFNNRKDLQAYIFAIFNAVLDGIAMLFVSIFLLIQMDLIVLQGTNLSLPEGDVNIYLYQAFITFFVSLGIIIGAIVGGLYSDRKSRKHSVYLSLLITTIALLLMTIDTIIPMLIFFGVLIGVALGWRHSSYSAVVGEFSKKHPEMDSTYFSICNSFTNAGSVIGLLITGIIFDLTASFAIVFIFMALFSNIGLIAFLMMDPADYEFKINNKKQDHQT
ncbi:MAG: MFS transporter [Promethearchaeota archaeon]